MVPRIDHIELTVADLDRAEPFYDELLPLLGFDLDRKNWDNIPKHEFRCVDYGSPAFDLTLICPRPGGGSRLPPEARLPPPPGLRCGSP